MKRVLFPIAIAAVVVASSSAAFGALSGLGRTTADSTMTMAVMPAGSLPAAVASPTGVTVTWAGSDFPGSSADGGYLVRRYSNTGVLVGGCSGTVAVTSCTETGVPDGTWLYAVTPVLHAWTGVESVQTSVTTAEGTP